MKKAEKLNNLIIIKFFFSKKLKEEFYKTLDLVKSLPGRKFVERSKSWTCPLSCYTVEQLVKWQFNLDEKLENWYIKEKKNNTQLELDFPTEYELYPFQKEGIYFLEKKEGKGLIADEMGLGKSCQSLVWLKLHPELRPAIIICPASLKINWKRECLKWGLNENIYVVSGRASRFLGKADIYIINYDILKDWLDILTNSSFGKIQVLILDEVQKIANLQAMRTKATRQLAKKTKHIIALSGTPITSRPYQFFSVLNLLRKDIFNSRWAFGQRYCGAKYNSFGWSFSGATHMEELHEILTENIMIRRLKKDVLKDLPDKQISIIPFEINNRDEYESAKKNIIEWITKKEGEEKANKASRAKTMVEMEKLKQLVVEGKIESCIQWISDFLESDEKLVIFCTHTKTIDFLYKKFNNIAVKLDGRDNEKDRQIAVDLFQENDNIKLFIGNIEAAGEGITLTASSNVVFLELSFVPAKHYQSSDRCHRIGQKYSVNVYYLIAENTIEEYICNILDNKRKVLDSILDGKETKNEDLLEELLNEIKREL